MKNLFDIKKAIITGGCGILGKSIANYLAEQGAKIVILDRVEEIGKELEAELNQKTEALFLVTDVLNKEIDGKKTAKPIPNVCTPSTFANVAVNTPDKAVLDLDVDVSRSKPLSFVCILLRWHFTMERIKKV